MLNKIITAAALIIGSGTMVSAQGFSGAELGIEYSDIQDIEDLGAITYSGSAEFELISGFSVAGDFSFYDFEASDDSFTNLTGHIIYAVNNATDIGIFFGQDFTDGEESGLFGAELAYDFGVGQAGFYFGSADDPLEREVTLLGASVDYNFGGGFGFEANWDRFAGDDFSASAGEIGGYYQMLEGPRFGATIGTFDQDNGTDESETYFALKASIAVGSNGGTTFGPRGVYEVVKGTITPGI